MIGETARQSVGMSLHLTNLAGLESGRVRVASIEEMPGHGLQQFALHMMGETGSELPEGVYRATNRQGLPEFDMHIMPSGSGEYTAYFALLNV
jgi:microcystin-dependent protein